METIKEMLVQADKYLEEISVSGQDVFLLSRARTLMKHAYDSIEEERGKDG